MRISPINATNYNTQISHKGKEKTSSRILAAGVAALTVAASVYLGKAIINGYPKIAFKNKLNGLSDKISLNVRNNIVNNDRGAEAVKKYKAIRANSKIQKFTADYLNGRYFEKSNEALSNMNRTIDKHVRTLSCVV